MFFRELAVAIVHVLANLKVLRLGSLSQAADALLTLESKASLSERSEAFSVITDLPQAIGEETQSLFIMILDEFQEISRLNHLEEVKKTVGDLYRGAFAHLSDPAVCQVC